MQWDDLTKPSYGWGGPGRAVLLRAYTSDMYFSFSRHDQLHDFPVVPKTRGSLQIKLAREEITLPYGIELTCFVRRGHP
jgi:hypothetical protein